MDPEINKIEIFSNAFAKQHLELKVEIFKKAVCAASNFLKIELFIHLTSVFPEYLMRWHFHWEEPGKKKHCGYHVIDTILYLRSKSKEKGAPGGLIRVVTYHPPTPYL